MKALLHILSVVVLVAGGEATFGQQEEGQEQRATNIDRIRSLAGLAASRAINDVAGGDSTRIQLTVVPKDVSWILEGGIVDTLRSRRFIVSESETAPYHVLFGLDEARVLYANLRRDGLFGQKLVDRTVKVRLSTKLVHRGGESLVSTSSFEESITDTIALSSLPYIENASIPLSRGSVPREGFFSTLAEPLIVVGSIAIAVLLLFNVRS